MTSVITRLLPQPPEDVNVDDMEEFAFLLYLWSFNLFDHNGLAAAVKRHVDGPYGTCEYTPELRQWLQTARWNTFYNADVVRLKLTTIRALSLGVKPGPAAEDVFYAADLPDDCAVLYRYLLEDQRWWPLMQAKLKLFDNPDVLKDITLDHTTLVKQCETDFRTRNVFKHAAFQAHHNMHFISKYNNFKPDDLVHDLLLTGAAYYYKVRPFLTRLHATNYVKSNIRSGTIKMIKYYTHPDRARLVFHGDKFGYSPTVVSGSDPDVIINAVSGLGGGGARIDNRLHFLSQAFQ